VKFKDLTWHRGRAVSPFGTYYKDKTQGGWEAIVFHSTSGDVQKEIACMVDILDNVHEQKANEHNAKLFMDLIHTWTDTEE